MPPLLKIRSERDQMSAIERRIADFILENAHLLRDYSSQQLANTLKISQSSVVKFSQKLGFKGYPDLKYSVGEAVARGGGNGGDKSRSAAIEPDDDSHAAASERLWHAKTRAEEETRLINPPETLEKLASMLARAGKVYCIGVGEDAIPARVFALRLALIGMATVHEADPVLMTSTLSAAAAGDVLLLYSEHGMHPALLQLGRHFRQRRGKLVSVTRHSANPLRAHADLALLVSAHDERPHIQPLLYHCALQHLLDLVFVRLCEDDRLVLLDANLERIRHVLES
jgi:DNA-binding MurR/RpiR family transcriptional regulator